MNQAPTQKRVVIIGAGVIGLSAAYYCAKAGHAVTLVDRQPAQRDGCSFGNAGMIVPSHFVPLAAPGMVALGLKWMWNPESPFYIKPRLSWDLLAWSARFWQAATARRVAAAAPVLRDFSLLSRTCYQQLHDNGLDFGLVKKGLLMLCKTQQTLDAEAHFAQDSNQLGVPAEVLDARATAARDPAITMDVAGSVYFPKDCHLPPERLIALLERELQNLGATLHWQTEVHGVRPAGERIAAIQTSHGEITGDEFILCGGAWSGEMGKAFGLNLPIQAGKGYSLTLKQPRQLPELCAIFTEARVAITPMDGALRVGGTMELAGLDQSVTQRRVAGIIRAVPKYYPQFSEQDFAGITPWAGLRPCAPDGMPYIGRGGSFTNVICAAAHAMMGLSLAPATGKVVEALVAGTDPGLPLALFSPERYS